MNIRSLEFIRHIWAIWVMDNRPELRFHDRPPTEICVSSPSVAEVKQGSSQRAPQETSETAYSKIDMAIGYFFLRVSINIAWGIPTRILERLCFSHKCDRLSYPWFSK